MPPQRRWHDDRPRPGPPIQFDSDAEVGQALNLLRQGQTDVIRGRFCILPVSGGLLYVQPVYVQSTGDTSYQLLCKILVWFGDKIAFEGTLDRALDTLFGRDSGVQAGDVRTTPIDPMTPTTPTTPTDPTSPTTPTTPSDNAALCQSLADYQAALADRVGVYAAGDLVAAAQADARMQSRWSARSRRSVVE